MKSILYVGLIEIAQIFSSLDLMIALLRYGIEEIWLTAEDQQVSLLVIKKVLLISPVKEMVFILLLMVRINYLKFGISER
jgi:hypothetical protein